ncbi:exonuclease V-like [Mizuhopecten yessoensis]|uniref:Exonuclease V n=1 Tax=Mizuhopecten yessoensis TaxID=6573 RepID=A0A210R343_MIZYE|nr:exonuclease V-like [Mizuhopecten yessoensis]OWF55301.1 Exonuclease V [Mizuhopecten yessoensis]
MTTQTDNEAVKSNDPHDINFNTEQFQLIDDDDDELLSHYISKIEEITEKCISAINTVGTSEDAGLAVTNAGLVSSHSATSSSSTCCKSRSEAESTSPLIKGENRCSTNPPSSIDHSNKKTAGRPGSKDSTDTACKQVSSDQTGMASSKVGQTDKTDTSSSVVSTNKTERPRVIIDQTGSISPLEDFRPGYLWVSDLTKQHWCEQQLLYSFTVPGVLVEDPVMTKGSNLHLQRELAVHDVVKVDITSSEDIWAVKMLNLLNSVQAFLNGSPLAREVPIFGAPFQEDVFVVGLIDELRFDLETYAIGLSELKTRLSRTKPSKSQEKQHRLQVMLYRKLFDDLVKGNVTKDVIARHLRLKLTKELGEGVQGELGKSGLSCKTLDSLLDVVFGRMAAVTCIVETSVEYVHQESGQSFLHQDVVYDEEELKKLYRHYLGFWRGQRAVEGVDIEDAWKCQRCDYKSVCEWREVKAAECARKNKLGRR